MPGPKAGPDVYTLVATDVAYWLDHMSTQLARAMSPEGVAPFGAVLTTDQKLDYYSAQLFNPDGSPNVQGRQQLMNLLGGLGFGQVYRAVIRAYPNLRLPTPPDVAPEHQIVAAHTMVGAPGDRPRPGGNPL